MSSNFVAHINAIWLLYIGIAKISNNKSGEKMKKLFVAIVTVLLLMPAFNFAQKLSGRAVMEKVLNKTTWKDMKANIELILTNSRNDVRKREITMFNKKRRANLSDMLMRFVKPADVRGVSFLLIENKNSDDDRYLYLPALRRIKRIASSGKGGNFMSSDFTYYDIGKPKLNDWKYKRLKDEIVNGHDSFQVECLPATPKIKEETGYGKIIRWIRKDIFVTIKSVYFDSAMRKWKVLEVPQIKDIAGVWFQTDMIMKDIQNNHTSEMKFSNIKVNVNLPENFFTQRYLQRVR